MSKDCLLVKMDPVITRIDVVGSLELGEGPHWEPKSKSLYFVDIMGATIHKYTPATNTHYKASIDGIKPSAVSLILPVKSQQNKFIISVDNKLGIITWDGVAPTVKFEQFAEVDTAPDTQGNRINDGKCDANGRIWFGSIGVMNEQFQFSNNASFYTYAKGAVSHHFGNVSISNGLAWNSRNTEFYYIDTPTRKVELFDYHLDSGNIINRRVLFDFDKHGIEGNPDGMTIDTDDNLWIAVFNGARILKVASKDGTLLQKIDLPAKQITSAAFGGENLDELYVTTARFGPSLKAPEHGALYKITNLGCKGFPANEAVL